MKSFRMFLAAALAVVCLAGCASTTSGTSPPGSSVVQQAAAGSPEAQIVVGAEAAKASIVAADELLRLHKITVTQAKGYRAVIAGARDSLKGADTALQDCRKTSGPAPAAGPDPCTPSVGELVVLALTNIANIKRALDAKQ